MISRFGRYVFDGINLTNHSHSMSHVLLTGRIVCVLRQPALDSCISLRAPRMLGACNRIVKRIPLLLSPLPTDSTVLPQHRYKPTPLNPNVPEKFISHIYDFLSYRSPARDTFIPSCSAIIIIICVRCI